MAGSGVGEQGDLRSPSFSPMELQCNGSLAVPLLPWSETPPESLPRYRDVTGAHISCKALGCLSWGPRAPGAESLH